MRKPGLAGRREGSSPWESRQSSGRILTPFRTTPKIAGTGRPCREQGRTAGVLGEAYSTFLAAFREAAEKLKAGDRAARFPLGSFPPALPFVSAYPSLPP